LRRIPPKQEIKLVQEKMPVDPGSVAGFTAVGKRGPGFQHSSHVIFRLLDHSGQNAGTAGCVWKYFSSNSKQLKK